MMKVFRASDIVEWYNANRTIPIKNEQNLYEMKLANLLEFYRKCNNPETIELDNNIPYWRKKTTVKAYNNTINLIEFYNSNNRFPSQIRPVNRKRTNKEENEYKLACWLNGLKQNSINNRFVTEILNKQCPNWNERNNPEENAINQANKVYRFWNNYNRLPRQINKINKNENEEYEYRLATWINSQKQSIKGNNKLYIYPEVITILNSIPKIEL